MKLSADQVAARMAECPGWKAENNTLVKTYTLEVVS